MKPRSFVITKSDDEKLDEIKRETGAPKSETVRRAIRQYKPRGAKDAAPKEPKQ